MNKITSSLLDNLLEGFQLIDRNWKYLYINKSAAVHGKMQPKDLVGFTMQEKYPGIENTMLFLRLENCMKNNTTDCFDNEFVYPDGTSAWFELRIEPVQEGLFILSIDITKRKHAEMALIELNSKLEERVNLRTLEIQSLHKDLTDSLRYARRIQHTRFPASKDILEVFPEHFVLFKPKIIVSGDFYFFQRKGMQAYFASADCTGHGVPGALLSMLCSDRLQHAVTKLNDLKLMLGHVNIEIKKALRQYDVNDPTRDGMDIALCCLNLESGVLNYTGANRPLWIIRNQEDTVVELKATKRAIGGYTADSETFQLEELQLNPGDLIYLLSDGYADLFNGQTNKKLTTKRLKQILLQIKHLSMRHQKRFLHNFAESWKFGTEQMDDILIFGIRYLGKHQDDKNYIKIEKEASRF